MPLTTTKTKLLLIVVNIVVILIEVPTEMTASPCYDPKDIRILPYVFLENK